MANYPAQGSGAAGVGASGSGTNVHHREGYVYNNGSATPITTTSVPHGIKLLAEGSGQFTSFFPGHNGTTSAFADYGGTVIDTVKATSTTHTLTTGDIVTIVSGTNYKGVYSITVIDANNFYFTATWVANDGAQTWVAGDVIQTTVQGTIKINVSLSVTPETANDIFKFCIYEGTTVITASTAEVKLVSATTLQNISLSCMLDVFANEKIWLSVNNLSGAGDVTIKHANFSVLEVP